VREALERVDDRGHAEVHAIAAPVAVDQIPERGGVAEGKLPGPALAAAVERDGAAAVGDPAFLDVQDLAAHADDRVVVLIAAVAPSQECGSSRSQ
jgi:hypothetical protein